jgi:hypothetical protein
MRLTATQEGASMETVLPESHELLIDCLRQDGPVIEPSLLSGLSPQRWQALLSLAAAQRVRPLLWHRLRQKGLHEAVPVEVAEVLRHASQRNTLRNLRLYGELRRLLSALESEGIPLILLKGAFLAEAVYENIGLREMNDIDVLARPANLSRIAEILTGMGYTPMTAYTGYHLPPMVRKGCASFEVHWNLTGPGTSYSIEPDGLWEQAMPVHIAGCDSLALSPEDLVLHLCMHASYQHQFAFGLRPSCDIAETISHFHPALNWQTLAERAGQRGWQRGVYLALRLAKELAGAEVPTDILERLRPTNVTEGILEAARAQILTYNGSAGPIRAPVAELLESRRLLDRIRIVWKRIFLPRASLATLYSVPVDSVRIYGCYPRRLVDVLRRHGHTLKEFREQDAPLRSLVARTNRIAGWLSGEQGTA